MAQLIGETRIKRFPNFTQWLKEIENHMHKTSQTNKLQLGFYRKEVLNTQTDAFISLIIYSSQHYLLLLSKQYSKRLGADLRCQINRLNLLFGMWPIVGREESTTDHMPKSLSVWLIQPFTEYIVRLQFSHCFNLGAR